MPQLPAETFAEVERLCAAGDQCAEADDYQGALDQFQAAWNLLPEPREDWSATLCLLGAIGDVHYFRGAFADARDALTDAVTVFPDEAPPTVLMRLGQCHYELGNPADARHWLAAAQAAAGDDADELFEEEDPKYLAALDGAG